MTGDPSLAAVKNGNGLCIWLTGLPNAGKSTLARYLSEVLVARGVKVAVFDGDEVRKNLSAGLGFSREDRHTNAVRVAVAARDAMEAGATAICALVSPYARSREEARRVAGGNGRFIEVYVSTPLEVCEARDAKGLYRLARSGKLAHFTGVNDPYEPPERPEVTVLGVGRPEDIITPIIAVMMQRAL